MYYVTFLANDRKIRTVRVPRRVALAMSYGLGRAGLHHVLTPIFPSGEECDAETCGFEGIPCDYCQVELTR